ncbi:hypothetical protein L6164_035967 [Bauhinia variegata]|uniref:Uncharacterized protein n=1 Tax=Bauhinia variegata TaxID=167791 RepID=A0ACB9KFJ7_BAUVA|nr:hypothetical protein L6164_035967 [Bauhinia variegata]
MESKRTMGFSVLSAMAIGLLAVAMSVSASEVNEISCSQALEDMVPCQDYLKGSGPDQPPSACCQNADSLFKQATSTQMRRDLCNCLKDSAIKIGVNVDRASKLAPSCKISLPFPIDPKLDCNSISLQGLMMERFN